MVGFLRAVQAGAGGASKFPPIWIVLASGWKRVCIQAPDLLVEIYDVVRLPPYVGKLPVSLTPTTSTCFAVGSPDLAGWLVRTPRQEFPVFTGMGVVITFERGALDYRRNRKIRKNKPAHGSGRIIRWQQEVRPVIVSLITQRCPTWRETPLSCDMQISVYRRRSLT